MPTRRDILGGLALAAMPVVARADEAGGQYIPVPIGVNADGTVFMRLWINGAGPYLFAMDSGASNSAIHSQLAQKLGLQFTRSETFYGVGGEEVEGIYLAKEVQFGPYLHQKGVAFSGMPHFEGRYAGLVAAGFLTSGPSVLDYGAKEIRIYVKGTPNLDGFVPIESYLDSNDPNVSSRIFVHATIDGIPLKLLVDTGADTQLLLYPSVVRGHDLWDKYGVGQESRSAGITGAVDRTRTVAMPDFVMGDVSVRSLPVTLMDSTAHNENNGHDGLLGSQFLKMFAVAVTKKGIALKPIAQAAASASSSSS